MMNLCQRACLEFENKGFKKDVDPTSLKESFNIIRQPDGQWLKSTKPSLHEAAITTPLDLSSMPSLKELTDLIEDHDKDIRKDGGRVFITEYLAYKIKRGTQTLLVVFENTERLEGKYRKLCDEMIEKGIERERFRTEETYMLTKNSGNEWSVLSSHENHSGAKIILDLKIMPLLKAICFNIIRTDSKFQANGGRIFITPTRIYRLSNKVEITLNLTSK